MTLTIGRLRVVALVVVGAACGTRSRITPSGATQVDASAPATFDDVAIARAEDSRRAKDVGEAIRTSHDVRARRRSARALARIADGVSVDGLTAHLADEDPETVAWSAYGLGYACKGREDAHVRMLAARAVSLPANVDAVHAPPRGLGELEPRLAIARAMGRCASALSEAALTSLLGAGGAWTDPALLGLGDLASRRKHLGVEAMTAVLQTVTLRDAPHDLAFYPLGRAESEERFARRMVEVARLALGRPGQARILAIRALGHTDKENQKEAAAALLGVVVDTQGFGDAERAEAARALGGLGDAGRVAIANALVRLTPDAKDSIAIAKLAGPSFNVLYTVVGALGSDVPKSAEASLSVLAALSPPTPPKPGFARRLADLRCSAALALAKGAYDAEVLEKCDAETSPSSQHARLASLLRRPLTRARLNSFRSFAKSEHLRIREEAVEGLGSHGEIGEAGASIIADALASEHAGLVATAAEVLNAHPDRAMVLAEKEKRAALDPNAPPPTAHPAREIAPAVAKALSAALLVKWPEDRFETRIALLEAAASVRLPQAEDVATLACTDDNPVVRERAWKALRTLGSSTSTCDAPDRERKVAAEIGASLTKPVKIILTTDAGDLTVVLEPELSPVTATRITSLAKSGFYNGIVVHRVVPGFVVQLGDPDGDGYGGSGTSLRCESSPVPFGPLDVGMALAGRDTGSSQFFVTLARTPHLDGEYARIGHAEGDWASVAQGDVVSLTRVVE